MTDILVALCPWFTIFWWKVYYLQRNMNYYDVVFDNQQLGKEFGSGLLEKFENTNYISL